MHCFGKCTTRVHALLLAQKRVNGGVKVSLNNMVSFGVSWRMSRVGYSGCSRNSAGEGSICMLGRAGRPGRLDRRCTHAGGYDNAGDSGRGGKSIGYRGGVMGATMRAGVGERASIMSRWGPERGQYSVGARGGAGAISAYAPGEEEGKMGEEGIEEEGIEEEGIEEEGIEEEGIEEEVEVTLPETCPGCGVKLQLDEPDGPGYCRVPQKILDILTYGYSREGEESTDGIRGEELNSTEDEGQMAGELMGDDNNQDADGFVRVRLDEPLFTEEGQSVFLPELDDVSDRDVPGLPRKKQKSKEPQPQAYVYDEDQENEFENVFDDLLCARCYSLKHYGRVKSDFAEKALPEFDFGKTVGRSISLRQFRRSVVLAVVDIADFDGSLPRQAIATLASQSAGDSKLDKEQNFNLFIAANKADLLPKQATQARLEAWVRKRVADGGLPKPSKVYIVSSLTGGGVKSMLVDLQRAVGTRGDVWVVGAQNAGKSSLINAMRHSAGLRPSTVLAAPLPGTTLDVVPVSGLVPKGCKMLDTPGVRHEYQLTSHLLPEEVKMILPRRHLKPRTYRLGEGKSISIGALARFDVCSTPGATIYLTLWASDEVSSHMGKTENAAQNYEVHAGTRMVPPLVQNEDDSRMQKFPALIPTDVTVRGTAWSDSSVDVCIAGLGWMAVAVNGAAELKVWAPPGIAITTRNALLPDLAKEFCKPGFDTILPERGLKIKKGKQKKNKRN